MEAVKSAIFGRAAPSWRRAAIGSLAAVSAMIGAILLAVGIIASATPGRTVLWERDRVSEAGASSLGRERWRFFGVGGRVELAVERREAEFAEGRRPPPDPTLVVWTTHSGQPSIVRGAEHSAILGVSVDRTPVVSFRGMTEWGVAYAAPGSVVAGVGAAMIGPGVWAGVRDRRRNRHVPGFDV